MKNKPAFENMLDYYSNYHGIDSEALRDIVNGDGEFSDSDMLDDCIVESWPQLGAEARLIAWAFAKYRADRYSDDSPMYND